MPHLPPLSGAAVAGDTLRGSGGTLVHRTPFSACRPATRAVPKVQALRGMRAPCEASGKEASGSGTVFNCPKGIGLTSPTSQLASPTLGGSSVKVGGKGTGDSSFVTGADCELPTAFCCPLELMDSSTGESAEMSLPGLFFKLVLRPPTLERFTGLATSSSKGQRVPRPTELFFKLGLRLSIPGFLPGFEV